MSYKKNFVWFEEFRFTFTILLLLINNLLSVKCMWVIIVVYEKLVEVSVKISDIKDKYYRNLVKREYWG